MLSNDPFEINSLILSKKSQREQAKCQVDLLQKLEKLINFFVYQLPQKNNVILSEPVLSEICILFPPNYLFILILIFIIYVLMYFCVFECFAYCMYVHHMNIWCL